MKLSQKIVAFFLVAAFTITGNISAFAFDTEQNSDLLLLINQEYPLPEEYMPLNTFSLSGVIPVTKSGISIREEAGKALTKLYLDMKKSGLSFSVVSGYRDYAYQTTLYENETNRQMQKGKTKKEAEKIASTMTAAPGNSEHQSGLAIDVSDNYSLSEKFGKTEAGQWLSEHAYQYGFLLRYPEDKQKTTKIIYEPWHFRYVGKPHAEYITKNGMVLEDYILLLQKEEHLAITSEDGTEYHVYYTKDTEEKFDNIIDISRDNCGGYIITTQTPNDKEKTAQGKTEHKNLANHWAETYIRELAPVDMLLIDPDSPITRGNFARLINNSGLVRNRSYPGYDDIPKDSAYYEAVKYAFETGIMNGKNGKFSPEETMTREYAANALSQMIQSDRISRLSFSDTDEISGWAFQDVQKLLALRILGEQDNNKFRPREEITFAEATQLIHAVNAYRNQYEKATP